MSPPATPQRGFTLVEILVVLAIIGLLLVILIPALGTSGTTVEVQRAKALIEKTKSALEGYHQDFGVYPPTSLVDKGAVTNGKNNGIESLVRCLSTGDRAGDYLSRIGYEPEELRNLDGDSVQSDFNRSTLPDLESPELVDPWGTPFVYVNANDYESALKIGKVLVNGEYVQPIPARNEETGTYYSIGSYQLWSCGPNKVNENGGGDDIASWK